MIPEFPTDANMKPVLAKLTLCTFTDKYSANLGTIMVWDDLIDAVIASQNDP